MSVRTLPTCMVHSDRALSKCAWSNDWNTKYTQVHIHTEITHNGKCKYIYIHSTTCHSGHLCKEDTWSMGTAYPSLFNLECCLWTLFNQDTCLIWTVQGRHLAVLILRQVALYIYILILGINDWCFWHKEPHQSASRIHQGSSRKCNGTNFKQTLSKL